MAAVFSARISGLATMMSIGQAAESLRGVVCLRQPELIERDVGVALEAPFGVPVGLSVAQKIEASLRDRHRDSAPYRGSRSTHAGCGFHFAASCASYPVSKQARMRSRKPVPAFS